MAVAVVGHSPTGLRTMVAVVADALTSVEIGAYGTGTGATAHAAVLLGNGFVGVVHEGVADVVDVHIVGFTAIVALTSTFIGTDANALVEPSEAFWHVALIIQHLFDMSLHIFHGLHRETASEDFEVIVVAFQLAEPVVGTSSAHGVRRKVGIVANEKNELKVTLGVGVDVVDVVLDLVVIVTASFGHANHRGRTT